MFLFLPRFFCETKMTSSLPPLFFDPFLFHLHTFPRPLPSFQISERPYTLNLLYCSSDRTKEEFFTTLTFLCCFSCRRYRPDFFYFSKLDWRSLCQSVNVRKRGIIFVLLNEPATLAITFSFFFPPSFASQSPFIKESMSHQWNSLSKAFPATLFQVVLCSIPHPSRPHILEGVYQPSSPQ